MRNRSRKFLMLIAVVVMAMVCFAFSASAETEGYYTYEVTDGEATITRADTSISGEVVIPDTLGGYPVTAIGEYAFLDINGITKVTIPESVTIIGKGAFVHCYQLKSVEIPDSVITIKEKAFQNCTSLESIVIPDSVTSSIGESAFRNCDNLHNVIIGNNVTGIDDDAFSQCETLYSVTIGNKVEYIGEYAFNSCGFSGIIIPSSVKTIGNSAFYLCNNLSNLIIWNGVTNIEAAAFMYCTNLGDVVLPESVISLNASAFAQSGITTLTIGKNLKEIGATDNFNNYTKLESIQVDEDNLYFSSKDGVLFNKNKTELICYPRYQAGSYTIPNGVINIAAGAFEYCDYLTEIIIPDSVETIGGAAFFHCFNLESIKLGTGLKSIGRSAFEYCDSITNVHFCGTQEQWYEVQVSDYNYYLTESVHLSFDSDSNGYCDKCGYPVVHTHSYISVVTPPTCTSQGYTTYSCSCGDSYVADYVEAKSHTHIASVTPPSCNSQGYTTYSCSCGDSYVSDYIVATGHSDNNSDSSCDSCGTKISADTADCSCNCHKGGFMGFIWKILRFFYKLFGSNKICACGAAHY